MKQFKIIGFFAILLSSTCAMAADMPEMSQIQEAPQASALSFSLKPYVTGFGGISRNYIDTTRSSDGVLFPIQERGLCLWRDGRIGDFQLAAR